MNLNQPDVESARLRPSKWPRFPELGPEWQAFWQAVLMFLLVPLLPLLLDTFLRKGGGDCSTLALAAAMYGIGIGASSRSFFQFLTFLVAGMVLALCGAQMGPEPMITADGGQSLAESVHLWMRRASWGSIGLMAIWHAMERYNRHVIDCEPAFEFVRRLRRD